MKAATLITAAFLLISCTPAGRESQDAVKAGDVTFRTMSVERLPELTTPRGGHHTALLGDEITVFGGHTNGFKPLQTAAYYSGGTWHEVQMMYAHDFGATVELPGGRVMLIGGTSDDFGIGQSWGVELYEPLTHTFSSDGILDRKRARPSAHVLPDGGVLVSGNWYAPDAVGIYYSGQGFRDLDSPSRERTDPFILPASDGQTVIFSSEGTRGEALDGTVDVLGGDPYHEPLLDHWALIANDALSTEAFRIAPFTYLMAARNREDGTFSVIQFSQGRFSLLDMEVPLASEGLEGRITWTGNIQVDRTEKTAWLQGWDAGGHVYLADIRYGPVLEGGKAPVSFYCATLPGDTHFAQDAAMMPGGRFALVGGVELSNAEGSPHISNFSTTARAFILHTGIPADHSTRRTATWVAALVTLALLLSAAILLIRRRRREKPDDEEPVPDPQGTRSDLMSRITALMEEKELFRRTDLKLADLALELGTNVTYISACINGQAGISFNEFLTRYRVRYAQELMKNNPDKKLSHIAEESGFSGERSFFRNFKKVTGVTPRQWVESGS